MKTTLILLLLLVTGCATPSTWLINDRGAAILCSATGWGYLGAPLAQTSHDQCVRNFHQAGYVDVPDVVLGIRFDEAEPPRITNVQPHSPAAAAGIRRGDVLQSIGGTPITNYIDLAQILRGRRPGDPVRVIVVREGATVEFTPTLVGR